jgi:hypothetical protein
MTYELPIPAAPRPEIVVARAQPTPSERYDFHDA